MNGRVSLLLAVLLAFTALAVHRAPTASAAQPQLGRTVLVGGDTAHRRRYQRWIDAARVNVRQVRAQVSLREGNCPGASELSACVIEPRFFSTRLRFYIPRALLDPGRYDPLDLKNTVLHELGHVYDFKYNRDHHRSRWLQIFAISGSFYADEDKPPFERFAVGYSYCAEALTFEQAVARLRFDVYEHTFTREQFVATCEMLKPTPKPT